MSVSTPGLYPVVLTDGQRERLREIARNGRASVKKVRHAQVLLWSDRSDGAAGYKERQEIAARLGMHPNSVDRVRKRFVLDGEQPALERRPRPAPPTPPEIDGAAEARIIAMVCDSPPEGHARRTIRLTASEAKRRGFVTDVCVETVRKRLKKTRSSRG